MKKFSIIIIWGLLSFNCFSQDKDKCTEWSAYTQGICYRYCHTYMGNDAWSNYLNVLELYNGTTQTLVVTYITQKNGQKLATCTVTLKSHEKTDPKVAISDGEKIYSIEAKAVKSTSQQGQNRRR